MHSTYETAMKTLFNLLLFALTGPECHWHLIGPIILAVASLGAGVCVDVAEMQFAFGGSVRETRGQDRRGEIG